MDKKPLIQRLEEDKERQIIYSDYPTKKFAKSNYYKACPRWLYLLSNYRGKKNKSFPIFISSLNLDHDEDVKNIEAVVKSNGVKKEEFSLIIFDAHTDMYSGGRSLSVNIEINMANWVCYLLKEGYSDISIVGVVDFAHEYPKEEAKEYFKYGDEVSYFVPEGLDLKKQFKNCDLNKLKIHSLDDFMNKKLRKYSFISTDCDVSRDLTDFRSVFLKKEPCVKISELTKMVGYVRDNSNLLGMSVYGEWFSFKNFPGNIKQIIGI